MARLENNFLEALVAASADAQSNLYEISFTGLGGLANADSLLKVRCDDFTPPEVSQEKYDVKYVTATIPRPRAAVNVTRNFTLNFRVDANYEAYKALCEQFNVTFKPTKSFATNDIFQLKEDNKLFNVKIDVVKEGLLSETPETMTLFLFKDCWITNITPISFKTGTSDPITVAVSISFIHMQDLKTGIEG